MKIIRDYCDYCNSERIVCELDDTEAKPVFNICKSCLWFALSLFDLENADGYFFVEE